MRKTFMAMAVSALVLGTGIVSASAAPEFHCFAHDDPAFTKVEGQGTFVIDGVVVTVSGPTVSFADEYGNPVTLEFCVKASGGNSDTVTGSSYTVDWTNRGGQTPDISYVVVYGPGYEPPPCDVEGCPEPS